MRRPIEQAESFRLMRCPDDNCGAIHFMLFDEDDIAFATMMVQVDKIPELVKALQDHAYRITVLREFGNEG